MIKCKDCIMYKDGLCDWRSRFADGLNDFCKVQPEETCPFAEAVNKYSIKPKEPPKVCIVCHKRPPAPNRRSCEICLAKNRERQKRRREKCKVNYI